MILSYQITSSHYADVFVCSDSYVLDTSRTCDGIRQCKYGADEVDCVIEVTLNPENSTHLASVNYPRSYPNNAYQLWSITVPTDYSVIIEFLDLDIEYFYDSLDIGHGPLPFSPNSYLAGSYDGNYLPDDLRLSSSNVWILFYSDFTVTYGGFLLRLHLNFTGPSLCDDHWFLNDRSAICDSRPDCLRGSDELRCNNTSLSPGMRLYLPSHNYPNDYPHNAYVLWTFQYGDGGNENGIFQIFFGHVHLGRRDYLKVGKGWDPDNYIVRQFPGYYNDFPTPLILESGDMFVEFQADHSSEGSGFKLDLAVYNVSDRFFCNVSLAVNKSAVCDGNVDCDDGIDEVDCDIVMEEGDVFIIKRYQPPYFTLLNASSHWNLTLQPTKSGGKNLTFVIIVAQVNLYSNRSRLSIGTQPGDENNTTSIFEKSGFYYMHQPVTFLSDDDIYVDLETYFYSDLVIEIRAVESEDIFTCPESFYIKQTAVCDGNTDCIQAADEYDCEIILEEGDTYNLTYSGYPESPSPALAIWKIQLANRGNSANLGLVIYISYLYLDFGDYFQVGTGLNENNITNDIFEAHGLYQSYQPVYRVTNESFVLVTFLSNGFTGFGSFKVRMEALDIEGKFFCTPSGALEISSVCDANVDCADGSDENSCPPFELPPTRGLKLSSYNFSNFEHVESYVVWRVVSSNPAYLLLFSISWLSLENSDTLTVTTVGADLGHDYKWFFEGYVLFGSGEIGEKLFPTGELVIELRIGSYGNSGMRADVQSTQLKDIQPCGDGSRIIDIEEVCDTFVNCPDFSDEKECKPYENIVLSLGQISQLESPGYPSPISSQNPVYFYWTVQSSDGSRLFVDVIDLYLEYEDSMAIGTGLDPQNDTTVIFELSSTTIYGYDFPPIVVPGSEFWFSFQRLATSSYENFFTSYFLLNITAVKSVEVSCPAEQLKCDGIFYECYNATAYCDGVNDCVDASDENCACPSIWEVRCGVNNRCVHRSWFCDGYHDCGEDEDDCTFQCQNGRKVSKRFVCDGFNDCGDYTDEREDCECASHQYNCGERCISQNEVCDGHDDCANGEDEAHCVCQGFEFECGSGGCVPFWELCDGIQQCGNASDEVTKSCRYCPGNYFQCLSFGACLERYKVCDGIFHCPDGSDEYGCYDSPPVNQTMIYINLTAGETTVLQSPNYPEDYPNNIDILWVISIPDNYSVLVRFIDFYTEENNDFLVIGTGDSPDDQNEFDRFHGFKPTGELRFFTQWIWIHFTSDVSVTEQGFYLELQADVVGCGDSMTRCQNTSLCIPKHALCDDFNDCGDYLDEKNCNETKPSDLSYPGCGQRPALQIHRVTHGEDVTVVGEFPWNVALYVFTNNFICGGSVIAPDWVLTAAHCVEEDYNFVVKAGSLSREYEDSTDTAQYRDVSDIFIHPKYNNPTFLIHDVALLKLASPLNFTDAVQPVCLPQTHDVPDVGSYITLTGWGSYFYRQGPLPDLLQKARSPVIPNEFCEQLVYRLHVVPSMFCLMQYTGYQSSCTGDSGGPNVQETDGRWTLYGVTSWGSTCGEQYIPSGKMRVSSHLDFIERIMQENKTH